MKMMLRKFTILFLATIVLMPLFTVSVFASSSETPTMKQQQKMVNIAHRGASGHAPENTIAAFDKAFEMKADYIEIDVQMTSDGRLVAIHDTTIDRDRKSTRLNSSHVASSYAVFCLTKKMQGNRGASGW